MTTFNGLVGIVLNFPVLVASTSLSSQRAVLIHQFEESGVSIVAFGPEGALSVATGGAESAAGGWSGTRRKGVSGIFSSRPGGAKDDSSAPPGQDPGIAADVFHGLRCVRLSADSAPPVATLQRPFGAKQGRGEDFDCWATNRIDSAKLSSSAPRLSNSSGSRHDAVVDEAPL